MQGLFIVLIHRTRSPIVWFPTLSAFSQRKVRNWRKENIHTKWRIRLLPTMCRSLGCLRPVHKNIPAADKLVEKGERNQTGLVIFVISAEYIFSATGRQDVERGRALFGELATHRMCVVMRRASTNRSEKGFTSFCPRLLPPPFFCPR